MSTPSHSNPLTHRETDGTGQTTTFYLFVFVFPVINVFRDVYFQGGDPFHSLLYGIELSKTKNYITDKKRLDNLLTSSCLELSTNIQSSVLVRLLLLSALACDSLIHPHLHYLLLALFLLLLLAIQQLLLLLLQLLQGGRQRG